MKKPLLIVIIILVVILALPVINLIRWTFQEKKPMDIIILDKTVPTLEREKHRSFTWILTNERFVKKNKRSYSYRKDYFGFFPTRPLREKGYNMVNLRLPDIIDVVEKSDALYYTDTYGIYMNDWFRSINKSRRTRKLYGGLNNTDYLYFFEMQKRNKLCILEYNSFDYPTADLERYKTKQRLGIEFGGWTGKYFSSLDTTAKSNKDFPIWLTAMYRKEYRRPWAFTKPGVVFITDRDIIVLEEGTHLKSALPLISTDSVYRAMYGISENVGFEGWFDVIDPLKNKVISTFNLETTPAGDTLLNENFLSKQFPAVITDTLNQRTYYFSGDFATNKVPYWTVRFSGVDKLKGILYSDKPNDGRRFFWLYYKPLINGIFTDYYNSLKAK
jgi:hypothetical protein